MNSRVEEAPKSRARLIGFLLGILAIGAVSLSASRAAFSDTTDNTGNRFSAGSVELVDDDGEAVLFDVSGMVPGDTVSGCIEVTYQGTIEDPGAVRLYSGGFTDPDGLAAALNLEISEGTGAGFNDCTGFASTGVIETGGTLADFDADHSTYATGAGTWDPAATPESVTYRFDVTLDANADDALQGTEVSNLAFIWEVQTP